jgi:hypothetical protein
MLRYNFGEGQANICGGRNHRLADKDKNDQQEVFTLNAVNYLTDPVKIFVASAATDLVRGSLTEPDKNQERFDTEK